MSQSSLLMQILVPDNMHDVPLPRRTVVLIEQLFLSHSFPVSQNGDIIAETHKEPSPSVRVSTPRFGERHDYYSYYCLNNDNIWSRAAAVGGETGKEGEASPS